MTVQDKVIQKAENLPLEDWDVCDTLDVIDCYDRECIVRSAVDGVDVIGTGMVSCDDLIRVEDIEIE